MLSRIRTWINAHPITVFYGAGVLFYLATLAWGWVHPAYYVTGMMVLLIAPMLRRISTLTWQVRRMERERQLADEKLERLIDRADAGLARHRALA